MITTLLYLMCKYLTRLGQGLALYARSALSLSERREANFIVTS